MNPIRVAIVGCGRISDLHEMGYRGREDARIAAVCDTRRKRARTNAKAWDVGKVYTDYQRILADLEIDLVELLVPHHLHAEMTVAACEFVFYPPHVRAKEIIEAGEIGEPQMIRLHANTGTEVRPDEVS